MTGALAFGRSLPPRYAEAPRAEGLALHPATLALVESQVRALLESSPAYHGVSQQLRHEIDRDLVKIAGYAAELVREEMYQSQRLGQQAVLLERTTLEGPGVPRQTGAAASGRASGRSPRAQLRGAPVRAQEEFQPAAANAVGRVTGETLRAISFPTFVADLIRGTFQAIVNASIQQMEAYGALLANVSRTVDQFMAENISDNQAREWLVQRYPEHIRLEREGERVRAVPRDDAEEREAPDFRADLGLSENVSLDESAIEEQLVPAARRKLASSRHQMLATMVLMGINRIVITGGKIRATMGFHIDTTDRLAEQRATDFDTRVAASGSFGFGPWSASLSASVAYVTSNRSQRDSEMNVEADLTSEVDLRFKSDYFPLERFMDGAGIATVRSATAVPSANAPSSDAMSPGFVPDANPPPRAPRPRTPTPPLRPIGTLPNAPAPPTAPTPPTRPEPPPAPTQPEAAQPEAAAGTSPPAADGTTAAANPSAGGTPPAPAEPAAPNPAAGATPTPPAGTPPAPDPSHAASALRFHGSSPNGAQPRSLAR
jgi:hypothetical protein